MDNLITRQASVAKEIEKLHINFSKDGPSRKTKIYLETRRNRLEDLWQTFEEQDGLIEKTYREDNPNLDYFTNNVHNRAEDIYEELLAKIDDALTALEQRSNSKQSSSTPAPAINLTSLLNLQRAYFNALNHLTERVSEELNLPQPEEFYQIKRKAIENYWTSVCTTHGNLAAEGNTELEAEFLELQDQTQNIIVALMNKAGERKDSRNNNNNYIKLPKITLPSFSGDYLSWTQFHDLFLQLIHNQNLGDSQKMFIQCRAILDSGSQLNFISKRISKLLELTSNEKELHISGIGDTESSTHQRANVQISSRNSDFAANLEVYILSQITAQQPSRYVDVNSWPIPQNIEMADPEFNKPKRIDMLLGAEIFCELCNGKQIKLTKDLPTLQETRLGWVVFGRATNIATDRYFCGISISLEAQLRKFWELEHNEPPSIKMSPQQLACENHFQKTVSRDSKGRFVVELPFLDSINKLGKSFEIAQRRFLSLEKRLAKNCKLKTSYSEFMKEYLALGQMELIERQNLLPIHYFMPHHCVLRPSSTTTKLRVVFDGSCKTETNISLNDLMHTGPIVQDDLFSIMLRFRLPKYVFTADISKMYRQILVSERDQNLQLILWRENQNDDLKIYRLRTVTYGTRSAPYLATRCLNKLADDEEKQYPLGAKILKECFYVDDLMTGSNSLQEAVKMQGEIQALLTTGGFELTKWCANNEKLLSTIATEHRAVIFDFDEKNCDTITTLGFAWNPATDEFAIKTHLNENTTKLTKRTILADVARIFDPLGLVSPVIALAKIFIQQLWMLKLEWDTEIPLELHTKWLNYRSQLKLSEKLCIKRHVMISSDAENVQLHAFSDASQKAYGTCIYIRSSDQEGNVIVQLLCSKSRVAPVKTISLPRLELCAATLMATLVNRISSMLKIKINCIKYWTDSTIVLSWINSPTFNQEIFVANRVSMIQQCTNIEDWNHISTKENPADLISRGVFPEQIMRSTLWFNGPAFLKQSTEHWPKQFKSSVESAVVNITTTAPEDIEPEDIVYRIDHKNSFQRLHETMGFIIRFTQNCRNPQNKKLSSKPDAIELDIALKQIIKSTQNFDFKDDFKQLIKGGTVSKTSKLSCLAPFIHEGIIRVGGRLHASALTDQSKHPMVVNSANSIIRMLIQRLHYTHLHAGPQALLAIIRQRFWPLQGRELVRNIVHNCVRCSHVKPLHINQLMGNLPPERVQPSRPFTNVGVDFCGPFQIHYDIRGKRSTKAYLAVFVGFATKAVHIELVTNLTTAAFIGALKRFIARRGCPLKIFCDNATNFMGAKSELQDLHTLFQSEELKDAVVETCSQRGIQWCPIPPRSPHFGGLWEAAVKSAKYHLKRILTSARLTSEELNTVVAEVEAVLNSRPLTPMSADPNDLAALTPGHFLIGQPLTSMPDICSEPANLTLLKKWELVKHLKKEFWRRWSTEYLQELQNRYKWKTENSNIKIGTLVLLKDDNLPPLKWRMARIIKLIKGPDNLVRVVELKTSTGITQRAIQKICPLPITTDCPPNTVNSEIKEENIRSAANKLKEASNSAKSKRFKISLPSSSAQIQNKRKVSDATSKPSAKKPAKIGSTLLNLLLIIGLVIPINCQDIQQEQVEITKFHNQPGIYFEELGPVNLINNDWTIFVYFNMTTYWQEANNIRKCLKRLKFLCSTTTNADKMLCDTILDQLQQQFRKIKQTNEVISNQHGLSKRKKRSPLNIVGNIAHALFGILDQDDALNIEHSIMEAKTNEQHLLKLIQNQSSIIESTYNIMKQNEVDTNNRLNLIENHMIKR